MWGRKSKVSFEEAVIVTTPASSETINEKPAIKPASSSISKEAVVSGSFVTVGDLTVEGTIEGDVRCAVLSVGAEGVITGNVVAETATIRGKVSGNVTARTILLAGSGNITGDLIHSVLIIEEGGVFEGRSKRVSDPMAAASIAIEAPKDEKADIIDTTKAKTTRAKKAKTNADDANEKLDINENSEQEAA